MIGFPRINPNPVKFQKTFQAFYQECKFLPSPGLGQFFSYSVFLKDISKYLYFFSIFRCKYILFSCVSLYLKHSDHFFLLWNKQLRWRSQWESLFKRTGRKDISEELIFKLRKSSFWGLKKDKNLVKWDEREKHSIWGNSLCEGSEKGE